MGVLLCVHMSVSHLSRVAVDVGVKTGQVDMLRVVLERIVDDTSNLSVISTNDGTVIEGFVIIEDQRSHFVPAGWERGQSKLVPK